MSDVLQSTLKTKLQAVLDNYVSGSTDASTVLNVALSVWAQNEANILVVTSVADLPYLEYYSSPNSILCFISNIGVFAISSNLKWLTLDGRLLRNDTASVGTTFSWGVNVSGQLGNNTTTTRSSPVSVVGGFIDWCDTGAGLYHNLAVRFNGTAWAWGTAGEGRLGDNAITNRSSPVSVVGGLTDWCQISAGCTHSSAVRTSGSAWAWGDASYGKLGSNSITNRSSPVSVVGGFSDWCQISGGGCHTAAVRTNGTAWSWGINNCGQLGENATTSRSSPVSVVGGFSDWCQISAGCQHSVAVRTSGSAWAWGANGNGRLGDNTSATNSSPVSVVGGFTDWCQISAGCAHTVALRTGGTVWSWGFNFTGQLGDCTTTAKSSPVSVVGGLTSWCSVSGGCSHSLAVRTNGSAWGWGRNCCGQLGDGTTENRSSPVSVVGGFTNWCQVNAGANASLGIRSV